jgi:mannose-6-phosphate isomerase
MRFLCERRSTMSATKLSTHIVNKPWGRHVLGAGFSNVAGDRDPVGEIWFEDAPSGSHELMVKYLFTSERLSIQVHPNDAQAVAASHKRGKEEAWIILEADPGSTIAIGTKKHQTSDALRRAAMDGSIEDLVDWKPVRAGDVIYLPAGTIHAIGAGITLVEIQQNVDLTYRLYDYGRPRELHLDEGLAVARAEFFEMQKREGRGEKNSEILVQGGKFVIEKWTWMGSKKVTLPTNLSGWFVPLSGSGHLNGATWRPAECWHIVDSAELTLDQGAAALFAYPGPTPLNSLD